MTKNHHPKKSLGQNFLVNPRTQQKIVEACAFKPEDVVVEIGPGKGALTHQILPLVKRLVAVEKDWSLAPALKEELISTPAEIIQEDFLKWDMNALPDDLVVVGNIPYYISTPIIEKILANKNKIQKAFLTVQLEFGERLAANAGNKDYGSLSCFVQYYADVKILFKISRGCFSPKPNVDSCFISLTIKSQPDVPAKNEQQLFSLIQKAFMQRRKTIVNALQTSIGKADLLSLLAKLKIDPQSRPENLTLLNYIELSNALEDPQSIDNG